MNHSYLFEKETISKPIINVGSTIPCRFGALLLLGLVVFSLAGCAEAKKILDTLNITPPSENYGAFATVRKEYRPGWALGTGTTRSEAQADAGSRCASLGYGNCDNYWKTFNTCSALALGRQPATGRFAYFQIVRNTRVEAEADVIQGCSRDGWPQCFLMPSLDGRSNSSYCANE